MKYMGSKRALLGNGLGELLLERVAKAELVVSMRPRQRSKTSLGPA